MDTKTLKRIAKALEELIALVKEDLKPRKKKYAKKIQSTSIPTHF